MHGHNGGGASTGICFIVALFTLLHAPGIGNKPFRETIEPPGRRRSRIWCQGDMAVISEILRVPKVPPMKALRAIYGF